MSVLIDRVFVDAYVKTLTALLTVPSTAWFTLRLRPMTEKRYWVEVERDLAAHFAEWAYQDYCATGVKR